MVKEEEEVKSKRQGRNRGGRSYFWSQSGSCMALAGKAYEATQESGGASEAARPDEPTQLPTTFAEPSDWLIKPTVNAWGRSSMQSYWPGDGLHGAAFALSGWSALARLGLSLGYRVGGCKQCKVER